LTGRAGPDSVWGMATKYIKITIRYAQARRIRCEHCNAPYSFVFGGTRSGFDSAGAMLADDNELRRAAFREAADAVDAVASGERAGRGRCPHCHRLQGWMRVEAGFAIGALLVLALILAGAAWFVTRMFAASMTAVIVGAGVAIVGAPLAVVVGKQSADSEGPEPEEVDPFVKTDEQLQQYVEASLRLGEDPFMRWWKEADKPLISSREKNTDEFSMGIWDQTEAPLITVESLTSAARSATLNAS
jgi:hypothetical protein